MMEGFDAYKMYVALKNHFTRDSYDFFKYNGRTKVSQTSFETRNDKYFFTKLGKRKDYQSFLVANFIDGNFMWVGDLVNNTESEQVYKAWLKRQESLTYNFTNDLDKIGDDFNASILVRDGQHPEMLKMLMRGDISPETVVILDDLAGFFNYWSKHIEEEFIWPKTKTKLLKYKPFVRYDKKKLQKLVVQKFS
jgi:hypothetical protein